MPGYGRAINVGGGMIWVCVLPRPPEDADARAGLASTDPRTADQWIFASISFLITATMLICGSTTSAIS